MEQTGRPGRIQISSETAELVVKAGKGHWLHMREECVEAKGKGSLRTFWLSCADDTSVGQSLMGQSLASSDHESCSDSLLSSSGGLQSRTARLIDWNVETLGRLLKQIVARREVLPQSTSSEEPSNEKLEKGMTFLEEVKEIIELPEFDSKLAHQQKDPDSFDLSPAVVTELREYITCVASLYRDNPFHNFEHASHVVMSVISE